MVDIDESGRCQCGEVEFTVKGTVKFSELCHCRACTGNRSCGPVHIIGVAPRAGLVVTRGADNITTFNYPDDSPKMDFQFCQKCGTLISQGPIGSDFRGVTPRTLNIRDKNGGWTLPRELWPKSHCNYESRTFDWTDDLPKYKTWPGQGEVHNDGSDKAN